TKLRYDPSNQSLRGRWLSDNCKETGEIVLFRSDIPFNFYENNQGAYASIQEITTILASNVTRVPEERESVVNRRIEIEPINFVFGSAKLTSESRSYISSTLVKFLKEARNIKLRISGHTDNVGEDGTNLQLSIKRAEAVAKYIAQNGIASSRLSHEGFGESKPVAKNTTSEGRRKNRRVEIKIEEE
ncbi:MAG: OmpA family protein, partial [Bacteroidota bacterium]